MTMDQGPTSPCHCNLCPSPFASIIARITHLPQLAGHVRDAGHEAVEQRRRHDEALRTRAVLPARLQPAPHGRRHHLQRSGPSYSFSYKDVSIV